MVWLNENRFRLGVLKYCICYIPVGLDLHLIRPVHFMLDDNAIIK